MLSILNQCTPIDLTHTLHPDVPNWTGDCGFHSHISVDYDQGYRVVHHDLTAGIGTHMDAPSHFIPDADDISELPLKNFIAPLCVIRTRSTDPDYLVSLKDIEHYESQHGSILKRSLIIADTGWAQYWENSDRYRNLDNNGELHFPGFSPSAVEHLLGFDIVGLGIDTLSPDGGNTEFPVHHLLLSRGKYIIENVAHLDQVPDKGAWAIVLPPKIKQSTEAICRLIALTL